uniref:Putative membrane-associated protein, chloroplastic n=1 Tax=Anthurium amnicola TaxID=1678845 RepID=A0A1D1Z4N1_9ARAE
MNIFSRFFRLFRSYANSILSHYEDPEKMLEQAILEMNGDLQKMHQATAEVLASQKRLENKYKAAGQASDDWYSRAQKALAKGDDSLGREALRRRKSYSETASSLKNQFDQQNSVVDSLLEKTRLLENKIDEARSKKDTLKLRAQTAKAAYKVNEILGNVNTSSALSAFERMEEKVSAMEYQVESINHLTTDDLERKFIKLESSSVDDDFTKLKSEMTEQSLKKLLSGHTAANASNHFYSDVELESELVEL